jgi:hypothetical protein
VRADSHKQAADAIDTTAPQGEPGAFSSEVDTGKSGTLPLLPEMGWRSIMATIRMQLQVFA